MSWIPHPDVAFYEAGDSNARELSLNEIWWRSVCHMLQNQSSPQRYIKVSQRQHQMRMPLVTISEFFLIYLGLVPMNGHTSLEWRRRRSKSQLSRIQTPRCRRICGNLMNYRSGLWVACCVCHDALAAPHLMPHLTSDGKTSLVQFLAVPCICRRSNYAKFYRVVAIRLLVLRDRLGLSRTGSV